MNNSLKTTFCCWFSLILVFCFYACNASIEAPEVEKAPATHSISTTAGQQLVNNPSTVAAFKADSNIEFSIVKGSQTISLSNQDQIIFELRNSTIDLVKMSRLDQNHAKCPESIKQNLTSSSQVICMSYITQENLTDIIVVKDSQELEVASWVFETSEEPDLVKLKIKLR